jgi:predicted O-linked N-acetylglucosamine transferase (SPINDLY family)
MGGQPQPAAERFRRAVMLSPDFVEAHVNLGSALCDIGQFDAAIESFRTALRLRPAFAEVNLNLSLALCAKERFEEAIACSQEGIRLRGPTFMLLSNLALAQRGANRLEDSIASYRAALALEPRSGAVRSQLANAYMMQGRTDLALSQFQEALSWSPEIVDVHSSLLATMLYLDGVPAGAYEEESRRFGARFSHLAAPAHSNLPDPDRPLNIGYVSPDFRSHSVSFFMEPVLARHDRSSFRVYGYQTGSRSDAFTGRLRGLCDGWRECWGISAASLAERIRADGIDVLVELSGHTSLNSLPMMALKPAPVQVSWIGYPAATGLSQIDYRLTDWIASPASADPAGDTGPNMGEELYRLPGIFSVYRAPQDAPDVLAQDDDAAGTGRAPDTLTFGSFNNSAKLSDTTVRLWSRILNTRPSARLMLKHWAFKDRGARESMAGRFSREGIGTERLDLIASTASAVDHLALYRNIDVALDPFPYCGVTTTCEALWMGVPVVTLAGRDFVSRMGLDLLEAVGHPEWVAFDEDRYVEIAVALASDREARASLRRSLREEVRASRLTDEIALTRSVEAAYRDMWKRWCAGAARA